MEKLVCNKADRDVCGERNRCGHLLPHKKMGFDDCGWDMCEIAECKVRCVKVKKNAKM